MGNYIGSKKHKDSFAKAQLAAQEYHRQQRKNRILQYNEAPTRCKNCGCPIEYDKRKNIFCSHACSASVSNSQRVVSDESKQKTANALRGKKTIPVHKDRKCKQCGHLIFRNRKFCSRRCRFLYSGIESSEFCKQCGNSLSSLNIKFCSSVCSATYRSEHPEEYKECRNLLSQNVKARVVNGTHNGWMHRNKFAPSYPEKYFIGVLDNWKIRYVREKKVGPYFIDFAIEDHQIAVEIDGKQHLRPDRMEHDKKKDLLLSNNGWRVIRIRWYNPVNDKNRELLYGQIENLKKILFTY